jgi:hypothetical protein
MKKERVNIQYSIDLEELPAEVLRLIGRASTIHNEVMTDDLALLNAVEEKNALSLNTLSTIDVVRKKLAAVDYALNDVSNIINGFLMFQVQANLQERYENDGPGPAEYSSGAQLEELQETLALNKD